MESRNNLYPIFLKTNVLHVLIVGGGNVAEEKLHFLLKSSPDAKVTIVSPMFRDGTLALAKSFDVELGNMVLYYYLCDNLISWRCMKSTSF